MAAALAVQLAFLTLLLHEPDGAAVDPERCVCASARIADGWCGKCGTGWYATVRVSSPALFEVLDTHGHAVDAEKTLCPACRPLVAAGGWCGSCRMGYVGGLGYFGGLSYALARGDPVDPEPLRRALRAGGTRLDSAGWCAALGLGIVGNRVFRDRGDFVLARDRFLVFERAVRRAAVCEGCAVAMVADTRCRKCAIEYRNGDIAHQEASP